VPASVLNLMEGVLRTMSLTRFLTVLVLVGLVVAGGAGVFGFSALVKVQPDEKQEEQPPAAKAPEKEIDPLLPLLKELAEQAKQEADARRQGYLVDQQGATQERLIGALGRQLKAELAVSPTKAARIAARERHLKAMQEVADIAQESFENGRFNIADLAQAKYFLTDAKIDLECEKRSR
jgi:hypothetical protein